MNPLDEYNKMQALKWNSFAQSVHRIDKAVLVAEVFADMGEWFVVVRKKNFTYKVMNAETFITEYPIRLKKAGA